MDANTFDVFGGKANDFNSRTIELLLVVVDVQKIELGLRCNRRRVLQRPADAVTRVYVLLV